MSQSEQTLSGETPEIPSPPQIPLTSEADLETRPIEQTAIQSVSVPLTSYADKTARLQAITQLIKTLQPLIWGIVLVVVLFPLTGKYLIGQSLISRPAALPVVTEVVRTAPDWSTVDQSIATALQSAELDAETFASQELDQWLGELEPRVEQFLDWYFDFINQKIMEFKTPLVWTYATLRHRFQPDQPTAQAAIVANLSASFEKEFSKRVLVPRNAQLRLETITNRTVDRYFSSLNQELSAVQTKYHLPRGEWQRYLSDISLTLGEEGSLSHLSLKTIAGGGTYLVAKPFLLTSLAKVGSKTTAKLASGATGKLVLKAGSGAIAELGAAVLDPLAGLGILAWDILDYRHTVAIDRPILKANLTAYLGDMKQLLLNQPETGMMSSIRELEKEILAKL